MEIGMAKVWQIRGWDGLDVIFECEMPGQMSEPEISVTLQRLVSRHLSECEVVSSSLRKNHPSYRKFLKRVGSGSPITYGENPYYTADFKDE